MRVLKPIRPLNLSHKTKSKGLVNGYKGKFICNVCYVFIGLSFACAIVFISYWAINNDKTEKVISSISKPTKFEENDKTCQFWQVIGDGFCDDEANVPECMYDSKDCCEMESDRSFCQNCTCFISQLERDNYDEDVCNHQYFWGLGDGTCDVQLNQAQYFFDAGDCCLPIDDLKCHRTYTYHSPMKCPEFPCIQSNNYCISQELGDGLCQDHNNGPFCDYDLGDCCLASFNYTSCCACSCKQPLDTFDWENFFEMRLDY